MGFLAPQMSAPPMPTPPPAAITPTYADPNVKAAGTNIAQRAAAANAGGMGGTIKTSTQGDLVGAPTGKASLLGQTA